jgi:hypothetical protein
VGGCQAVDIGQQLQIAYAGVVLLNKVWKGDGVLHVHITVLFSGQFWPNSPILPQDRPHIFKFKNSTGSMARSSEFSRS